MTKLVTSQLRRNLCLCSLLTVLIFPVSAFADTWQLQVGAQTGDILRMVDWFLEMRGRQP